MKRIVIGILLVLLSLTGNAVAQEDNSFDQLEYLLSQRVVQPVPKEVNKLVDKLEKHKKDLALEYKSRADLEDTVLKVWKHTKDEKDFGMYKILSIAICESRLNQFALNRVDGGKGLLQVMKKYWKEELPNYHNPYNKDESIQAGIDVLKIIKKRDKCSSWKAVERYNGKCYKARKYRERVYKVYRTLKA